MTTIPNKRPEIIVPDTSPLIHLAAVDALSILTRLGQVIIADMVVYEATADLSKPWAVEIASWIEEGTRKGSDAPIKIEKTETGETFRLALMTDPLHRMPNAGENAIIDWLSTKTEEHEAIVVYENGRVPRAIERQGFNTNIAVMTTRALLDLAEFVGIITSGEELWKQIETAVPTINRANKTTIIRRITNI